MNKVNLKRIVDTFQIQELSVVYFDADPNRRKEMEHHAYNFWPLTLEVSAPVLSAKASPHCNVLITVNENEFDPIILKEINMLPAYMNGNGPIYVQVYL